MNPERTFAVVITTCEGKTNTHGKVQYAAFMRNKEIRYCPMFLLSYTCSANMTQL